MRVSAVELAYALPAADVAEYVTLFYEFRADLPMFEDVERADNAQLRFRLQGGDSLYTLPDGTVQHGASVHLRGPTSGAMTVRSIGPVRAFGWGMTPRGWAAIVGRDASAMLDRVTDAHLIFGTALDAAAAALAVAPDLAAMVAIAEPLVRTLAQGRGAATLVFADQVDAWLEGAPSPDVEVLATATGLSRRQLERRCKVLYGAPPKLLARKFRALRAAVALYLHDASPADLIAHGFYDQSHLIREIKQFTGLTPRQIRAEPGLLAQLTINQRHALDGLVSPLVSRT
jgi:AraC-like DNA-binding protein